MGIHPIRIAGDPVLRTKAKKVKKIDASIQKLIDDMIDTMHAAPGVGLAAPQIGESLQLVVIEDPPHLQAGLTPEQLAERERAAVPFHVLVNPRLTSVGDTVVSAYEGCLSFSSFLMIVPRWKQVRVEALDQHGEPVVVVASGWYARILQHEVDHLRGVVCCDRMDPRTLTTADNHVRHWRTMAIDDVYAKVGTMPDDN